MSVDQKSFSEVMLNDFSIHNPHCTVTLEDKFILIDSPWAASDVRFKFLLTEHEVIADFNNVWLNPQYDAMYHVDTNIFEVFFSYLDPNSEKDLLDRKFTLQWEGNNYKCGFKEPTARLFRMAKHYEVLPSANPRVSAPQLLAFKDGQNLDTLPPQAQRFFQGKIPRSFFIESDVTISQINLDGLVRHINFLMKYYDRGTPRINIKDDEFFKELISKQPVQLIEDVFPDILVAHPIDEILLRLTDVASKNAPRFAFLYYYQVFEYAGYSYIDDKAKKAFKRILKDPAFLSCGDDRVGELFSIFADVNHNDDVKMRKVIEEHCDPLPIWKEIENDKEFFSNPQSFDGGFVLDAWISMDTTVDGFEKMWMPKVFDQLTKVRNCLVHAREKRENKVIMPSKSNDNRLKAILPIIARIAEQVALRT